MWFIKKDIFCTSVYMNLNHDRDRGWNVKSLQSCSLRVGGSKENKCWFPFLFCWVFLLYIHVVSVVQWLKHWSVKPEVQGSILTGVIVLSEWSLLSTDF